MQQLHAAQQLGRRAGSIEEIRFAMTAVAEQELVDFAVQPTRMSSS